MPRRVGFCRFCDGFALPHLLVSKHVIPTHGCSASSTLLPPFTGQDTGLDGVSWVCTQAHRMHGISRARFCSGVPTFELVGVVRLCNNSSLPPAPHPRAPISAPILKECSQTCCPAMPIMPPAPPLPSLMSQCFLYLTHRLKKVSPARGNTDQKVLKYAPSSP